MNFYNPYYYAIPTNFTPSSVGLMSRLFGRTGTTISSIINGTQRVLNIANQAIPLVKQAKPLIGNAKTMFRVMNEFKRVEINNKEEIDTSNKIQTPESTSTEKTAEGPTFFI